MSESYIATAELPIRLLRFTEASLDWCKRESEQSVLMVMQAIDSLLKKTERIASISTESLHALNNLKGKIGAHFDKEQRDKTVSNLVQTLEDLSREHRDVGGVISPIIEALQFQDLLRQNLENILKMMNTWVTMRAQAPSLSFSLVDVGEALLKCMTTVDERAIIRRFIEGLPEEEVVHDQVAMF